MDNSKKGVILIVDDEVRNRNLAEDILEDEGYKILLAENGYECLRLASEQQPDVILLDIMMPGMDGYEVCKQLKDSETTKEIPVIFLTAKSEMEDETRGLELGAVDYITKPISLPIVLARIKTHLELKFNRDLIKSYNEKLETMLEQRTRELIKSERQAAFGQLVQGLVHNMRTPLNVISMTFELMEIGLEQVHKLGEGISDNAKEKLNKAMLMIANQFERGQKSTECLEDMFRSMMLRGRRDKSEALATVNLNDIILQEVEFMSSDLTFKNKIEKTIELDEKKISIEVVPAEIAQVIQNLFRNAIDAMHLNEKKKLVIKSQVDNGNAVFSLSDTGQGIRLEIQSRIFDPFFTTKPRADDEKKESTTAGTGLGLWMCKETIESYGGNISVKSEKGKSTTFTIRLPLKQQQ